MHTMRDVIIRIGSASLLASSLMLGLPGCGASATASNATVQEDTQATSTNVDTAATATSEATSDASASLASMRADGAINTADLFTERDLAQEADLAGATLINVTSGEDVQITNEGIYLISGEASDVTITVNADDTAKVQLVLDGVHISNQDAPAIYVVSADKVFVTTAAGSTNALEVTGAFVADGDTNTDAVIFSKDDLVLNGLGSLTINSTDNGISCKDDLKITGGTYAITASSDAIEANDSIRIADGTFAINAAKDALHAENDEDDTLGYIYICGGTYDITAGDDGIQATTVLQIDDGSFTINAVEALEATYVQINNGSVGINASDDGINATTKSNSIGTPTIEVTGGTIVITMGQGDTDAIDANGNIVVSGGSIDITAQSAFDYDGTASFTGGTITVNGEQVSEITNSMMMGGMGGGPRGGMEGGPMGDMGGGQMGGPQGMGGQLA